MLKGFMQCISNSGTGYATREGHAGGSGETHKKTIGNREMGLRDRGKTSIVVDTILNQKQLNSKATSDNEKCSTAAQLVQIHPKYLATKSCFPRQLFSIWQVFFFGSVPQLKRWPTLYLINRPSQLLLSFLWRLLRLQEHLTEPHHSSCLRYLTSLTSYCSCSRLCREGIQIPLAFSIYPR